MKSPALPIRPTALLAVFAHPDDESFRCGGTLALLAQRGVRVQLLTATRGQAGSRGNPPLCSPEEIPDVRERELRCACEALGILPPVLLDYQDGRLSEADPERIVAEIQAIAETIHALVILSYGPYGISGHPDHIVIGRFAADVFQRTHSVEALYTPAVPHSIARAVGMSQIHAAADDDIAVEVDVSTVWQAKMAAIQCHRTQLGQSPILDAPSDQQRLFLGTEHFRRAQARTEEDFFQSHFRNMEGSNR